MLSDRERRVVQESAQMITADDATFAARPRDESAHRRRKVGIIVMVAVLGLAGVCVTLVTVTAALVVTGVAGTLLARRGVRPDGRRCGAWEADHVGRRGGR